MVLSYSHLYKLRAMSYKLKLYDTSMEDTIQRLRPQKFPPLLKEIPNPPKTLYIRGKLPEANYLWLCVVGSRKYTPYGKTICEKLLLGLSGYPIVIVSGLALGIDAIAHHTALEARLPTVAVPGSGLHDSVLYPRTHIPLARKILYSGGALLSEFEPKEKARPEYFPKRNRIMAGISHAVLVVEAEERSGTLITARLAVDYNRDVLTVPGPLFSSTTEGPHYLIRNGATLIRKTADILDALNIKERSEEGTDVSLSSTERKVLELLRVPCSRDELFEKMKLPIAAANVLIGALELKGIIVEELGVIRRK